MINMPLFKVMIIVYIDDTGGSKTVYNPILGYYWNLGNLNNKSKLRLSNMNLFSYFSPEFSEEERIWLLLKYFEPLLYGICIYNSNINSNIVIQGCINFISCDQPQVRKLCCTPPVTHKYSNNKYLVPKSMFTIDNFEEYKRNADIDYNLKLTLFNTKKSYDNYKLKCYDYGITDKFTPLYNYSYNLGMNLYWMFPEDTLHTLILEIDKLLLKYLFNLLSTEGQQLLLLLINNTTSNQHKSFNRLYSF